MFKVLEVDLSSISQVSVIRDRGCQVWHLGAWLLPDFKKLTVGFDFLKSQQRGLEGASRPLPRLGRRI